MTPLELFGGAALVVLLLGVSGYFGRLEYRKLRRVRTGEWSDPEERDFYHKQARRRLFCCGLMVVFALFLIGTALLEGPLQDVVDGERDPGGHFFPGQKLFLRFYVGYWVAALLVLFTILATAAVDLWALRAYSIRAQRRLNAERREMIREEIATLRRQRAERN